MTNDFTCLGLIAVVFVVAILENPCLPDAADPIKFDDAESKKLFFNISPTFFCCRWIMFPPKLFKTF
jgi:hypothetical protein